MEEDIKAKEQAILDLGNSLAKSSKAEGDLFSFYWYWSNEGLLAVLLKSCCYYTVAFRKDATRRSYYYPQALLAAFVNCVHGWFHCYQFVVVISLWLISFFSVFVMCVFGCVRVCFFMCACVFLHVCVCVSVCVCVCGNTELSELISNTRAIIDQFSKAKAAKLLRELVDIFLNMRQSTGREVRCCC